MRMIDASSHPDQAESTDNDEDAERLRTSRPKKRLRQEDKDEGIEKEEEVRRGWRRRRRKWERRVMRRKK